MNEDEETNVWLTVIKLVLGAALIIGGTGFALWYFSKEQERSQPVEPATSGKVKGWGIVNDSPIRNRR
jgi:hypothetical protein